MERLSCFPADCSSGSLAACSQGWLGIPEAQRPWMRTSGWEFPQSATSRDHGLGPPGDTFPNLTQNRNFSMDWRRTWFFCIFRRIPQAGSCRALCTGKVRSKCLMHTENRVHFGLSLLKSQIFSFTEHTTALLFPKAGFYSVMPTTAWGLKADFPILSLEIGHRSFYVIVYNVASFMSCFMYCLPLMIFSLVICTYGLYFLEYKGISGKQSWKREIGSGRSHSVARA